MFSFNAPPASVKFLASTNPNAVASLTILITAILLLILRRKNGRNKMEVITNINGTKILSANDFSEFRKNAEFGDKWKITIVRNGIEKIIELTYTLY